LVNSVDVSSAPKSMTRTQGGASDRSASGKTVRAANVLQTLQMVEITGANLDPTST
jgi:hypothetical protein